MSGTKAWSARRRWPRGQPRGAHRCSQREQPARSSALLRHFNVVAALWFVFSILAIAVGTALAVWPAIEPPWLLVQSIAVAAAFAATGSVVRGAAVTTVTVLCGIEALRALDRGLTAVR